MQRLGGKDVWAYKDSPVGPRVWTRVVSAPVWLPPGGTPPESLVLQTRIGVDGAPLREVNRNLIGPGYASAYGLVAAYHRRYGYGAGGDIIVGGDEGIRSHGSSDYTSIWRRASLGCHRLHNHLAIRLFNFIVAHRAHRRIGHGRASFRMPIVVGDFSTVVEVKQTGYGFELARPIRVDVLPGQVRGRIQRPPKHRVPFSR